MSIDTEKRNADRLGYINELEHGWHDGEGKAPSKEFTDKVLAFLTELEPLVKGIPLVHIYPIVVGQGVSVEWSLKTGRVDIDLFEGGHIEAGALVGILEVDRVFDSLDAKVIAKWLNTLIKEDQSNG